MKSEKATTFLIWMIPLFSGHYLTTMITTVLLHCCKHCAILCIVLYRLVVRDTTKPGLWTMDWTMDWAFLYEMSCLTTTWFVARLKRALLQREGQMGVLPSPSPSLDIYSLITTITFFFRDTLVHFPYNYKATPINFIPLYLENHGDSSNHLQVSL